MNPCEHKVQYYETDGMGIVHHSNYIRWFEEARVDLLRAARLRLRPHRGRRLQRPVLEVSCQYKTMSKFGETVSIQAAITQYNGVRMTLHYDVFRQGDRRGALHRRQPPLLHQFRRPSGDPAPLLAGIRRRARVPRYR